MSAFKKLLVHTLFCSIFFNVYAKDYEIDFQNQTESDLLLELNGDVTSKCITTKYKQIKLPKLSGLYPTTVTIDDSCPNSSARVIWNINGNTKNYIMWDHQNRNGHSTRLVFNLPQYTWVYSRCGDGGFIYCDLSSGADEDTGRDPALIQFND